MLCDTVPTGTLDWKNWKIEEAGLTNVLRRPGTPFIVEGNTEREDYEPIANPHLGNDPWPGEYQVWHDPPVVRMKNFPDSAQLLVSWYHPAIIDDGQVTYCTGELTREEIEGVGYEYGDLDHYLARYPITELRDGLQTHNGESVFYISNPALGLWAHESRM